MVIGSLQGPLRLTGLNYRTSQAKGPIFSKFMTATSTFEDACSKEPHLKMYSPVLLSLLVVLVSLIGTYLKIAMYILDSGTITQIEDF